MPCTLQLTLQVCVNSIILRVHIIPIHTLVKSEFLSAPEPLKVNSRTSQADFSFTATVQNDTPITIKAFHSKVVINANCNTNSNDPLTLRMCERMLGNVNTDIRCNYSQPYHIDCNIMMDLTSIKNTMNVYPITFFLGTESYLTGIFSKRTAFPIPGVCA